jgi:multidrug efflux pump subunit AcrA (membrane-fusion protein)
MRRKFIVIGVIILVLAGAVFLKLSGGSSKKIIYQTVKPERGSLIVSVSATGSVSTANSAEVTTEASGVIDKILVENGQKVTAGQPIAVLTLDIEGQQRYSQALSNYQSAQNSLYSLQSAMLAKWDSYMKLAQSGTYQNSDGSPKTDFRQLPAFMIAQDDWLSAEAAYKNAQNNITQSYLSYLQASPTIYAPIAGVITGFGLQIGSVVTAQSNSSGGSTAQKIASVVTEATPTVTVSLSETDVPSVRVGNLVTVTLGAFPDKTYTGKVISVDTVGSVSSNVTTYPAVIKLDVTSPEILTNMSATANIITASKNDVLTIPVSALTNNTVQVLKNGKPETVTIEVGLESSTEAEILAGLTEDDEVITGSSNPTAAPKQTTSVFGGFGGGGVRFQMR